MHIDRSYRPSSMARRLRHKLTIPYLNCQHNLNLLDFRHTATGTLTKELTLKMRRAAVCSPYLLVLVSDRSSGDAKLITTEISPQTHKVSKTFQIFQNPYFSLGQLRVKRIAQVDWCSAMSTNVVIVTAQ